MRAARFDVASLSLEIVDVPIPEPRRDEVLVRVEACGICLSDVHLIDGSIPAPLPIVIPGHEAAGVVETVGEDVVGWKRGESVVLAGGRPCRRCAVCRLGRFDDCLDFQIMGFAYDGAWAEYVTVPYYSLAAAPSGVPFEQVAILADAVSTPYAGLVDRGGLHPGESVGIWGVGGLGVHAVQIARLVGAAPIVAVDPNPVARKRAIAAGADHALDPASDTLRADVLRLTGGRGVDLAVDLVGANAVLAQAQRCLARSGRLVMIGLSMEPVLLAPGMFLGVLRQSILGHLGYQKRHLEQVVTLVDTRRLDVSGSVSDVLPLDEVADGVRRLREKDGDPVRLVLRPHS